MADLFLSYARENRQMAAALAQELKDAGFSVWWDYDLQTSDDFRREIDFQLSRARALIVLWTHQSVSNMWVLAETDDAFNKAKIVFNMHSKGLDCGLIPKPFNQLNSVSFDRRGDLITALSRQGIKPAERKISIEEHGEFIDHYPTQRVTLVSLFILIYIFLSLLLLALPYGYISNMRLSMTGQREFDLCLLLISISLSYLLLVLATRRFIELTSRFLVSSKPFARTTSERLTWFGAPNALLFKDRGSAKFMWSEVTWIRKPHASVIYGKGKVLYHKTLLTSALLPADFIALLDAHASKTRISYPTRQSPPLKASLTPEAADWVFAYTMISIVISVAGGILHGSAHALDTSSNLGFLILFMYILPASVQGFLTARVLKTKLYEFPLLSWCALYALFGSIAAFIAELGRPVSVADIIDGSMRDAGFPPSSTTYGALFFFALLACTLHVLGNMFGTLQALILRRTASGLPNWIYWSGFASAIQVATAILNYYLPPSVQDFSIFEEAVRGALTIFLSGIMMIPALNRLRQRPVALA